MITGFNHNIKYKNRIFHIQTEDSGSKNPHIITHLFVGGNIVATNKADYRHLLSIADANMFQNAVKTMMEEQHKQMLRNLIHGKYDNATNVENAHHLDGPAPLNVDPNVLAATGGSGNKGPSGSQHATLPPPATRTATPPPAPAAAKAPAPVVAPPPAAVPRPVPQADTLGLAGAAAALIGGGAPSRPAAPAPVVVPAARPSPAPVPAEAQLPPEVLAARALKEKPAELPATDTIFGEDLISEKSLDEVILSYLADEND